MDGNRRHQMSNLDFTDPFNAGQMVGMLVMLTFIEKNKGISKDVLEKIKDVAAENVQGYFDKPTEDIHLMIQNIVKEAK